jgi:peptidyl-dipeptidase Dcp
LDSQQNNPLLQSFTDFDASIPFSKIKVEHYLPALEASLKQAHENVQSIKSQAQAANFENTILALENASELMERVVTVYSNLESAHADDSHRALSEKIYPLVSNFSSDVSLDQKLFEKVQAVYQSKDHLNLNAEQKRLTEKTYLSFTRNGALLSEEKKTQLREIDQQLSVLSPQFSDNVLKATNAFELIITDRNELAGLPDSALEAAAFAAENKGHKNSWLFNLQHPSLLPVLTYAKSRPLREKMWKASSSKSFNDKFDNQNNIKKIVQLKHERAQLLGYPTHADYVLTERMAKDSATVNRFLSELLTASRPSAVKDLAEVKQLAAEDGVQDLKPWDFGYYSEKLKEKKYAFNQEELRPYFKLENVIEGAFEHARRLYDLNFKELHNIEVYHPEVKVFEVTEKSTGKYIGLFYTDFFPRETKRGGAWMTSYRDQGYIMGQLHRPHISIVCNFTKPTPTKPSLLTLDEVLTLFHEFGHALHGLLSDCSYRSLSGTNVYWDFVELPSQIMENWVTEKESLDLFAKHFETQESIPASLVEKLKKSDRFQAGWLSLRQLQFAIMDMQWHSTDPKNISDVDAFETAATEKARLFDRIPGTNTSCSFSHIFAGGYSAGYYSYKWAEVLDADAFEYFKEKGLFNPEVAKAFKNFILSRGGTEHPMELYKKFRGREPDPKALLRRDGLDL